MALKFKSKTKPETEDTEEPKTFKKKAKAKEVTEEEDTPPFDADAETPAEDTAEDTEVEEPAEAPKKSMFGGKKAPVAEEAPKKSGFLKTGSARQAAIKADEQRAKAQAEKRGKLFRFYINAKKDLNKDFTITFVDGNLDDEGMLENPVFHEHTLKVAGKITNFVSCCDREEDPLQAAGQEPYLAQAFTIIDHTGYTDKDGVDHPHQKRLLVAKRNSMKQLQKLASKRGGLTGCTFEVSRTGAKQPNIGDTFDFVQKGDLKALLKEMTADGAYKDIKDAKERSEKLANLIVPADYEGKELTYYSAAELKKMGLVDIQATINAKVANEDAADVNDEL